ncbi:helix-turn-helix domain-containing protein [Curtobacterium sp. USHLN213]|uniref:helix-turn-helix domain-containing protein n=1 Tax=Curtobacterium sp. USHLN213 TaxID=3081255 RepID=UPI00301841B3
MNNETPEIDPYTAAFAAELRAERGRKQIGFDEIAAKTGINKRTLFRLFDGERDLRAKHLIVIAEALDVTPQDLITRAMGSVGE